MKKRNTMVILSVIVLIIILFLIYSSFIYKLPTQGAVIEEIPQTLKPSQEYLQYKIEVDHAANFDEYIDVMLKYSSKEFIDSIFKAKNVSAEMKEYAFNAIKKSTPAASSIINITEKFDGDFVSLYITTEYPDIVGNAIMVKEDNVWKLKADHWEELNQTKTVPKKNITLIKK